MGHCRKFLSFLTLITIFCIGGVSARHKHTDDIDEGASKIRVKPLKMSKKEQKGLRKLAKKEFKDEKISKSKRKLLKKNTKKEKKEIAAEKRKSRQLAKRAPSDKPLDVLIPQREIEAINAKFTATKSRKHALSYMKKVQAIKRKYPETIVSPMKLKVTKKKKGLLKNSKSIKYYEMGPHTNYIIRKY